MVIPAGHNWLAVKPAVGQNEPAGQVTAEEPPVMLSWYEIGADVPEDNHSE